MKTYFIHKDLVKAGDTIVYKGNLKTVCSKDILKSDFIGRTIFGDSFKLGLTLVEKVEFQNK